MKHWLGVVSKEHVLRGKKDQIAQVCHGKKGPLAKMQQGDWLIYYSPGYKMGDSDLRAFTAVGQIADQVVYQYEMAPNFIPYRRKVIYVKNNDVDLTLVKNQLELTQEKNWGMKLRRGLIEISAHDFNLITQKMGVNIDEQHENKI